MGRVMRTAQPADAARMLADQQARLRAVEAQAAAAPTDPGGGGGGGSSRIFFHVSPPDGPGQVTNGGGEAGYWDTTGIGVPVSSGSVTTAVTRTREAGETGFDIAVLGMSFVVNSSAWDRGAAAGTPQQISLGKLVGGPYREGGVHNAAAVLVGYGGKIQPARFGISIEESNSSMEVAYESPAAGAAFLNVELTWQARIPTV